MQQVPPAPHQPGLPQAANAPQTRAELDALVASRSELRDQLSAATQRRIELLTQQRIAGDVGRAEIGARIATLDQRSASLEQQIQGYDEAIAAGLARGLATTPRADAPRVNVTVPPMFPRSYSIAPTLIANGATLVLMAILFWAVVRRGLRGSAAPAIPDQSRRLDQLQQAVDTMAVEIERISEGQRYVTKVLSERLPATTDRPN